jgi:hypothetical protein
LPRDRVKLDLEAHCKPKARMAIFREGEAQDRLDFEETPLRSFGLMT